jgi:PAS domain S-box-containing protein
MSGLTVLIVEDQLIVSADLAGKLHHLGYNVAASSVSGEEAVVLARQLRPSIVLMDIQLAGAMDGIEAADIIRRESDLPVVFLTAHSDEATIDRAKHSDAFGYIVKPFEERELKTTIEMAVYKHASGQRLRESEQRLKRAQEIAHLGSWDLDLVKNELAWSDETYRIFGLRPQEFSATYEAFLEAVHPDDRAAVDAAYFGSLRERRDTYEIEHRVVRKNTGEIRTVREKCEHVRDASGRIIRSVGMVHDITEHKQAEEEVLKLSRDVAARNLELEAVNKELEAFSYSVSHDLLSPLRSIDGFSRALLEDHSDRLDAEGRDFLGRILAASQRMGQLIDDLLNLSRVSRTEMRREQVDLSGIVAGISARLRKEQPGRNVAFAIGEGLSTYGDERLLNIVMDNLIGNAWKFTGNRPDAIIEFGAIEQSEKIYFVKDNGAGLDMTYADKLFAPFQRLHKPTEFPGTGIGLATVKRIIERHGGRVWIEGEKDKGVTVYFTLP